MSAETTTSQPAAYAAGWIAVRMWNSVPTRHGLRMIEEDVAAMAAATRQFLAFWARLAYRDGDSVPVPAYLSAQSILDWAARVLAAALADEGDTAPDARRQVQHEGGKWYSPSAPPTIRRVRLVWDDRAWGSWVVVEFIHDDRGVVVACRLAWCSGTGEPADFFHVEALCQRLEVEGVAFGTALGDSETANEPFPE
ncbi:hypothetical protein EBZ39_01290 [bacterium]|nr:hypothetical protein [bacterium]